MEMWLKTNDKSFRFPVLPSSITIGSNKLIESSIIVNMGEVAIFGGNSLKTTQISSFFPSIDYTFCAYSGFPKPYECVKIIEDWRKAGQQVRFIVTDTDINMLMLIESFEYGESAGSRDVEFSISLREYKPITIKTIPTNTAPSTPTTNPRPENKPTTNQQKIHKVKKGDCLWDIAQKYYGKGSRYPEIKKANQTKYPKLKKSNVIYVGWELIIP